MIAAAPEARYVVLGTARSIVVSNAPSGAAASSDWCSGIAALTSRLDANTRLPDFPRIRPAPRDVPARASVHLVEHPVNDDAGYRNVQPERQRPPRNSNMAIEAISKRLPQCYTRERWNHRGEHDV